MASKTSSRSKTHSPRTPRKTRNKRTHRLPSSPSTRAVQPRTRAKSAARGNRASPEGEVTPAVRQEWQRLASRWKKLLPKLTGSQR